MNDNATPRRLDESRKDSTPAWKVFGIPAVLALAGYCLLYACDTRLRIGRGAWAVTFLRETNGTPALHIRQSGLGISNIQIRFPGEHLATNPSPAGSDHLEVVFDEPRKPVPFGTVVFDDLMYQPGTVVLQCFGHEVQMLPRALYLNRKGQPWVSGEVIDLTPASKPPELPGPPARGPRER